MRILLQVGAAGLMLIGGLAEAQARGGRIRGGGLSGRSHAVHVSTAAAQPARVGLADTPQDGTGPAAPVAAPRVAVRPIPPVAKPPARVADAAPWCASERLVGAGAGFCEIN